MKPFSAVRLVAMSALLGVFYLFCSLPLASQETPKVKRFDQRDVKDLTKRNTPFVPLQEVASSRTGNVVEVTLVVSMKIHELNVDPLAAGKAIDRIRTRSYNSGLCGPVIRVKPGDQLKVHLKNDIKRWEKDTDFDPNHPNLPHGFNVTNLHTHGLNVSPLGHSDNVFLEVGPEEAIDLCFDIPADHPAGTFWYHAHKDGSVALQLAGGMAGVLIVDGGKDSLDKVPEIAAATVNGHEKILCFQQIPYRPDPSGKPVDVLVEDVYANPETKNELDKKGTLIRDTLINGELFPTLAMRPGEVQRWRCVHAGLEGTLDLALVKEGLDASVKENRVPLNEIAVDGLPLGTLETWSHVELQPGYRSDLLVKAPPAGTYILQSLEVAAANSIRGTDQKLRGLARIKVEGAPINPEMKLPEAKALALYPEKQGLKPILDAEVANAENKREIKFRSSEESDPKKYWINGGPFKKDVLLFQPKLNTAEEWTLHATAGKHPFHVHINPFSVERKNEAGKPQQIWRDTLFISDSPLPGETEVLYPTIRLRFKKFTGKTVLHCHNLRHEDQGMMGAFEIVGTSNEKASCPPLPLVGLKVNTHAPDWELPDAEQKSRKQSEFKGKKQLLVFSRGSECVHCRAQIQALTEQETAKKLSDAGLTVLIVCAVSPDKLPAKNGFPLVALSDERRVAFKDYGCFDGRALHGTFLIDTAGKVQWQSAGDEPFMGMAELATEAGKLK